MKHLFVILAMVWLSMLTASAENNPYRDDFQWVGRPDHADWLYRVGEEARVEVQLYRYGMPYTGEITYEVADDMGPSQPAKKATMKLGRVTLSLGKGIKPGFRDLRLKAVVDGQATTYHVKVGFSPEKIAAKVKQPADFDRFWQAEKDALAKQPLHYTIEEARQHSTDKVDAFLVKLTVDRQGHAIYAYLFKPKNARRGAHPVVLCPPGAGVKTIKEPGARRYYAENGCIRMEMEIHGLDPRLPQATFSDLAHAFGNYLDYGIDSRDHYYMKHVYLSLVRAIDLLTSLPEWDGKNVIVQGGSQGGALSIVAAGLDSRVTQCIANHPALADMAAYMDGQTEGYPHYNRSMGQLSAAQVNTLAYFDVVNFARRIKAVTRMTWGYNDDVCPPTTSYAVWNVLTCPKEPLITPVNEHWTSAATEESHCKWLLSHLK